MRHLHRTNFDSGVANWILPAPRPARSLPERVFVDRLHLPPAEPLVEPTLRDQLRVGSLLRHTPMVDDTDAVCVAYRGEAVGDDDRGALLHESVDR